MRRIKGQPTIMDNGKGGTIVIREDNSCYVTILQKDIQMFAEGPIKTIEQSVELCGTLEDVVNLQGRPGAKMSGEIVIVETQEPPDKNDPEKYLSRLPDNTVERRGNKPVWRRYEYRQ
jgi:hypothetical protein